MADIACPTARPLNSMAGGTVAAGVGQPQLPTPAATAAHVAAAAAHVAATVASGCAALWLRRYLGGVGSHGPPDPARRIPVADRRLWRDSDSQRGALALTGWRDRTPG